MPPPPPPPPPPQVANDDCAKKSARRATVIERKIRVFMAADYNRGKAAKVRLGQMKKDARVRAARVHKKEAGSELLPGAAIALESGLLLLASLLTSRGQRALRLG